MKGYEIVLNLQNQKCLIVGGGAVATRKVEDLLLAGAQITVVSPQLAVRLTELEQQGLLRHCARVYQVGDLQGFFLVICATNDTATNYLVAQEARSLGVLFNATENPQMGNFTRPSVVAVGKLNFTVHTAGVSPRLTKLLREDLQAYYGEDFGRFIEFMREQRQLVKEKLNSAPARELFWRKYLTQETVRQLHAGNIKKVEEEICDAISSLRS